MGRGGREVTGDGVAARRKVRDIILRLSEGAWERPHGAQWLPKCVSRDWPEKVRRRYIQK